MQRTGFKEWSSVCEAVLSGRQTVIIRKGGIAEGRAGFSFKHREFYLFPTQFHEQAQKITEPEYASPDQPSADVTIKCAVAVEWTGVISDWSAVEALAPFHILRQEVVRERFDYKDAPGIHVAFVRAFRVSPPWIFPNEKRFGGCRSWLQLPDALAETNLELVLSHAEHEVHSAKFFAIAKREIRRLTT